MVFIELTQHRGTKTLVNALAITSLAEHGINTMVITLADEFVVHESRDQIMELIEQAEESYNRKVLELGMDVATSGVFDFTMKAVGLE